MKKPKVSIIMTAHVQNRAQCHMTMASIANVTRYTDPKDYEFILVSNDEKHIVRDDYKVLKIDKYLKTEGLSYTQAMNFGFKEAKGDCIVFMQNDVFVWDNWLTKLKSYLDLDWTDCIFPDQCPRDYAFVTKAMGMDFKEAMQFGSRDEGLFMIKRDSFIKTGGFDENLSILAMKDFYSRLATAGVRINDTCKVMISHIMAATNLDRLDTKPEEYNSMMKHDADILNV
jgi:GT2 family glycosyltransferase